MAVYRRAGTDYARASFFWRSRLCRTPLPERFPTGITLSVGRIFGSFSHKQSIPDRSNLSFPNHDSCYSEVNRCHPDYDSGIGKSGGKGHSPRNFRRVVVYATLAFQESNPGEMNMNPYLCCRHNCPCWWEQTLTIAQATGGCYPEVPQCKGA